MPTPSETSKSSRKGPTRSEASKAAILDATRIEMAENGWRGFSVDGVAKRASASKQTIYKWWPSIGAMCVDAALALIPDSPDGGRDPLRVALTAAADDKDAGELWRAWMNRDIRMPMRMLLAELAGKRVIRRDFDLDEAIEEMLGPLWHRILIMRAPVREGFCSAQSANFLKVYAAS